MCSKEMAEAAKVGPVAPELVLKKHKRNEEWNLAKKQVAEVLKKKNVANRKLIFNRVKQYSEGYELMYTTFQFFFLGYMFQDFKVN